jgi:hypothetical protein
VADLESGVVVRPCRRRARRPVPGQADLRHPLAPVLLHVAVQLRGGRRRRRRPACFMGCARGPRSGWAPPLCWGGWEPGGAAAGAEEDEHREEGADAGRASPRLAPPTRSAPPPAMTSLARHRSVVEGAGRSGT